MIRDLCEKLAYIRKRDGIPAKDIYSKIPTTPNGFLYWETGKTVPKDEKKLIKWCELLGVEVKFVVKKIKNT